MSDNVLVNMCHSPNCCYQVSTTPEEWNDHGKHCCHQCWKSKGRRHGPRCEKRDVNAPPIVKPLYSLKNPIKGLVSVIIPTFNRMKFLLNAIASVNNQTYTNVEIIVINDGSTEPSYAEFDPKKVSKFQTHLINIERNSRQKFGNASPAAYARNLGLLKARGEYIAFLDDDDYWLSNKLEIQIQRMRDWGYEMSATQTYGGLEPYSPNKQYKLENDETFFNLIRDRFRQKRNFTIEEGFPDVFSFEQINIHNCIKTSSVVMSARLIREIGDFDVKNRTEDYDYWRRTLKYSQCAGCLYIKIPLTYYDNKHGDGRLY